MNSIFDPKITHNYLPVNYLKEKVKEYAKHAFAQNTIDNYKSDWKLFSIWCNDHNIETQNIDIYTLIAYVTTLAENNYKASSIQRKISAITKTCETKNITLNLQHKDFKIVWQGIRRKLGIAKQDKDPILLKDLEEIISNINPNTPKNIRDKALLVFGWFSAMRRSEIIALNWDDISFIKEGILVTIRQSKTDKYSEGQKIAILKRKDICPIKILKAWKKINHHKAVFCSITKDHKITGKKLSGIDVARIVKKWAEKIDLDTAKVAGHSLRRGFVTTAVCAGIRNNVIMKTTRHKSSKMIDDYTSDHDLINNNATNMIPKSHNQNTKSSFTTFYNKITAKLSHGVNMFQKTIFLTKNLYNKKGSKE